MQPRPVLLNYFASQAIFIEDDPESDSQHVLASVVWLKEHHANGKEPFIKPVGLWWQDLHDFGLPSFIHLQLVMTHFVKKIYKQT